MIDKRTPIPVTEAVERVKSVIEHKEIKRVRYDEALGYYLAEDIIATYDIPMFDKSPYDGFAIRSKDSIGASGNQRVPFKVIDHIGAGVVSSETLKSGEAVRIMTGAQIPSGADAVVMFEQTSVNESSFTIRKPFKSGENIAKRGEECRAGDTILHRGTYINAGVVAVLATFSYVTVSVYEKPTVALIATGTELANIEDELQPGQIRNSNGPMIAGFLNEMAIVTELYAVSKDDYNHLYNLVTDALHNHDIVITTGGVSVGDFDYMPKIYKELGANVLFNKVAMRPGSVTTVTVVEHQLLFGLSGNPSACALGFELFIKPAVRRMQGASIQENRMVTATLSTDFLKANPFTRFVRASIDLSTMTVTPARFTKSNAVVSIAESDCFIILPGGTRGFTAGDKVDVMLLRLER